MCTCLCHGALFIMIELQCKLWQKPLELWALSCKGRGSITIQKYAYILLHTHAHIYTLSLSLSLSLIIERTGNHATVSHVVDATVSVHECRWFIEHQLGERESAFASTGGKGECICNENQTERALYHGVRIREVMMCTYLKYWNGAWEMWRMHYCVIKHIIFVSNHSKMMRLTKHINRHWYWSTKSQEKVRHVQKVEPVQSWSILYWGDPPDVNNNMYVIWRPQLTWQTSLKVTRLP